MNYSWSCFPLKFYFALNASYSTFCFSLYLIKKNECAFSWEKVASLFCFSNSLSGDFHSEILRIRALAPRDDGSFQLRLILILCWKRPVINPRHRPNIQYQQVRREKKLRLWQLLLPVWTTSIFIAFENAKMSVISTDYTTFFFFYCLYPQTRNDGITVDVKEWVSFMPYQNKTKQKKFLFLAAHIYEAPCSRSGLYHLHEGFW